MAGKGNHKVMVRCPWCQRQPVPVKRGRISSHLTPGGQRCVGQGQPVPTTIPEGRKF